MSYRFRCPECHSCSLLPVHRKESHDYRCNECTAKIREGELVDTKSEPAPETSKTSGWDVSDTELIGTVRRRSD